MSAEAFDCRTYCQYEFKIVTDHHQKTVVAVAKTAWILQMFTKQLLHSTTRHRSSSLLQTHSIVLANSIRFCFTVLRKRKPQFYGLILIS